METFSFFLLYIIGYIHTDATSHLLISATDDNVNYLRSAMEAARHVRGLNC